MGESENAYKERQHSTIMIGSDLFSSFTPIIELKTAVAMVEWIARDN